MKEFFQITVSAIALVILLLVARIIANFMILWIKSLFRPQTQKIVVEIKEKGGERVVFTIEITFVMQYHSSPVSPSDIIEICHMITSHHPVSAEEAKLN